MRPRPLPNASRSLLISLTLGSALVLMSGCGGGGNDNNDNRSRSGGGDSQQSAGEFGYPDRPNGSGGSGYPEQPGGVGAGTGCTADVLNESKYTAITDGMSLGDVQSLIGCRPFDSIQNATVWMSEEFMGAQLVVHVDASQRVILKGYMGPLASLPPSMPSPIAGTCTSAHVNQNNFDAIANGMSPDQVNQLIGCRPSRLARYTDYELSVAESAYDWLIPIENQPNPDQLISVGFDDATGLSIYKTPQGL